MGGTRTSCPVFLDPSETPCPKNCHVYPVRDVKVPWSVLKGRSSAGEDAEGVNSPASGSHGYFISALSRFTLEVPLCSAKLNIAIAHVRSWGQVLSAAGKGSAPRMKGESEWEKDTELEKRPRELAKDIGWAGLCVVASASELNCCHPHTFKSFRGSSSSKPGFPGCR